MATAAMGQGNSGTAPALKGAEIVTSGDHGAASPGYANATAVDTIELGEGAWKITATGAINVNSDPSAPNCGLRDQDGILLAKQNFATGSFVGRSGFSLVGATEGPATVDLVCYGTGTGTVFEHNIVAISGATLSVDDDGPSTP
jgi:hypothetical protein